MKSDAPKHKKRRIFVGVVLLMIALFTAKAWNDTMIDPQVMRTTVTSGKLSANSDPITVALISDIHVAGPDMPPERLKRIVTQVNALEPDYLFVAGDFISEKRTATRLYTATEAIAPFSGLNSEIRKIAVPGNHDHWFDMPALKVELKKAGFMLLANEAAEIGPFVIGRRLRFWINRLLCQMLTMVDNTSILARNTYQDTVMIRQGTKGNLEVNPPLRFI